MQDVMLELRTLSGQAQWPANKLFGSGQPMLWAPAMVWQALHENDVLVPGKDGAASVALAPNAMKQQQARTDGVSWVFVPTYNRYHAKPDKQMLLDWADAMPEHHPYVRCIVVRPVPDEIQVSWHVSRCSTFLTTAGTNKAFFIS